MSLATYRKKRNFRKTPEPAAGRGSASKGARLYVIQKHAASRLHYDFRLELDGTLKSWAVPKGPSLDPHRKQLAVHVEDHPVSYGDFEGTIPQGEYGGGTVMVWDQGTWEPHGDAAKGYRAGKLSFTLHGQKLHGSWTLVAMHGAAGENGKNWLLIKQEDDEARPSNQYDILKEEPDSVLTRRGLDEIARNADRVWKSNRSLSSASRSNSRSKKSVGRKTPRHQSSAEGKAASPASLIVPKELTGRRRGTPPEQFSPQLATLVSSAPQGETWLHEMKFDGYRILAFLKKGKATLITRNGNDWTRKFPAVRKAVEDLDLQEGILDGELVLLREDGIPDFQRLQNAMKEPGAGEFTYYVFDLPYCHGYDLRRTPLIERKTFLQQLLRRRNPNNIGIVRYSEHLQGQGKAFADQSCLHKMEGIVSKRTDSHYESGRTQTWVKTKCHHRQEFVIGGCSRPSGRRSGFGSLLLGYYEEEQLRYCGRVGTGFTAASLKEISRQLHALRRETCPFSTRPSETHDLAFWVSPDLVAEVEFSEWTDDGLLRHPSFKGLRQDKPAKAITREQPRQVPAMNKSKSSSQRAASPPRTAKSGSMRASSPSEDQLVVTGIALTHPERVVYPSAGITKGSLAEFYVEIADWILPHIINRPLTLVRCPSGEGGECFYQKHFAADLPAGLSTIPIKEKTKTDQYVFIRDLPGLISLVQYGVMEFHPWGARVDQVERPDRMVFDLDPGEGTSWGQVLDGVREIRERLHDLGLTSFLRTSGGKGLHVVVPLVRRSTWEEVKEFSHQIAQAMSHDAPDRYTAELSKARRKGRIFVDYLRNGRGATAVASYSGRARKGAPVATPLRWEELSPSLQPNSYTVLNLPHRLASLKGDPWEGFFHPQQSLTKKIWAALGKKSGSVRSG